MTLPRYRSAEGVGLFSVGGRREGWSGGATVISHAEGQGPWVESCRIAVRRCSIDNAVWFTATTLMSSRTRPRRKSARPAERSQHHDRGSSNQYQRRLQLRRECGFGRGRGVVGRGRYCGIGPARTDTAKAVDAYGGHVRGACNGDGDGHCAADQSYAPRRDRARNTQADRFTHC